MDDKRANLKPTNDYRRFGFIDLGVQKPNLRLGQSKECGLTKKTNQGTHHP
ncbi:hypothetical protein ENHYDAX1_240129 [Enhydrobacter sp. AX1]|nr:hypothetical protein ENHYDAX1_240129 [Enhydrobacter sp. AX1]